MADAYEIRYAAEATDDVRRLSAFGAKAVLSAIAQHLRHAPTMESRSRIKKMDQPFWSQYRLRVNDFRAYYDVDEASRVATVSRVLLKGATPTPKEKP